MILTAEERAERLGMEAKSALGTLEKLLSPVENERTGKTGVRLPSQVVRHSQVRSTLHASPNKAGTMTAAGPLTAASTSPSRHNLDCRQEP